jgi:phosphate/sulfate permease
MRFDWSGGDAGVYHRILLKIRKIRQADPSALPYTLVLEASMILWKRAALLGFLSWMVPFIISFMVFPLKKANAPLFGTLMSLVVLLTAAALLNRYFRNRPVSVSEAVRVGVLWLAINLLCDYPMFAYGPMKMTAWGYYSEIGLAYLAIPIFALGAARLARS